MSPRRTISAPGASKSSSGGSSSSPTLSTIAEEAHDAVLARAKSYPLDRREEARQKRTVGCDSVAGALGRIARQAGQGVKRKMLQKKRKICGGGDEERRVSIILNESDGFLSTSDEEERLVEIVAVSGADLGWKEADAVEPPAAAAAKNRKERLSLPDSADEAGDEEDGARSQRRAARLRRREEGAHAAPAPEVPEVRKSAEFAAAVEAARRSEAARALGGARFYRGGSSGSVSSEASSGSGARSPSSRVAGAEGEAEGGPAGFAGRKEKRKRRRRLVLDELEQRAQEGFSVVDDAGGLFVVEETARGAEVYDERARRHAEKRARRERRREERERRPSKTARMLQRASAKEKKRKTDGDWSDDTRENWPVFTQVVDDINANPWARAITRTATVNAAILFTGGHAAAGAVTGAGITAKRFSDGLEREDDKEVAKSLAVFSLATAASATGQAVAGALMLGVAGASLPLAGAVAFVTGCASGITAGALSERGVDAIYEGASEDDKRPSARGGERGGDEKRGKKSPAGHSGAEKVARRERREARTGEGRSGVPDARRGNKARRNGD